MKKSNVNIGRVFLCAALLCVLAVLLFVFQTSGVDAIKEKLTELDRGNKGMENIFWLVDEVAYLLPVIFVALALMLVYRTQKGEKDQLHREQGFAIISMMVFLFALFMPIISAISPEEGEISVFHQTLEWFIREGIFLVVLALYHFARAESSDDDEDEEPEEVEEFDED